MRSFRIWTGILSLFFALASQPVVAAERPLNLLVLYADDWRHDTLGIAGNPVVHTPNLDALARNGFRFTRACVTTSICGVSRASLLTGQWMSRHGNRAFDAFKTPWAETFPGLLRTNGYHVGHVGKWHNGKFPADRFDFARAYSGVHWIRQKDGSQIHVTQKNEADALEFLASRPRQKPFCLTVAFFAAHAEDQNPKQYLPQPLSLEHYRDAIIPIPKTATDASFRRLPPFIANDKNEGRVRWTWRFNTPERYQDYMKNYYRLVTEVDATCGRILTELEKQDLLQHTLVLFTTDNGYFHGEYGLADKWYPHEESIRVPLIVRDPRMLPNLRGATHDAFVLNVDLAPTLLGAARIAPPATMQGRDFSPFYTQSPPKDWRTEFFYEHPTIRDTNFIPSSEALVRQHWKFVRWPDFQKEQLFHLTSAEGEDRDLHSDPAHADRLTEMRQRFEELKRAAR